ncbi:glycosyltransferase family 2 protein [Streptomyces sp. NPDC014779]|uniref:glycosyltransferase family 2 protein n=1 Tax=unclassified Streptomyces TaxID=2593676 RepID=UPI0037024725
MSLSPSASAPANDGRLSVVVIAYNDEELVGEAIRSALDQGAVVAEVVAVNDASSDATGKVLDELAALHPRVRVVHREDNSGGCGTPRNDGIAAATAPYVMFLDSDDVLPPGAADALVAAAERHRTPVAAGLCVRRELPEGRDVPWQPELYADAAVLDGAAALAPYTHDTLCVNKVYRRSFLSEHGIRFPDGRFVYEDFVFSARVLAAAPRVAVIPDTVYVWHVRRAAAQLSISLDRKGVENWTARIEAHRQAVAAFADAGRDGLAAACRTKFLEHDVRLYARELPQRGAAYQSDWWALTHAYLSSFEEGEIAAAAVPARWLARLLLAAAEPRDLTRAARLAANPGLLLPPYARVDGSADGTPVWAEDLPGAVLDGVDTAPLDALPLVVDATLRTGPTGSGELRLTVRDLYGRVRAAGPRTAEVGFVPRGAAEPARTERVTLAEGPDGWTARLPAGFTGLARAGRRRGTRGTQVWDLRITVECADGTSFGTVPRLAGVSRRSVLPSSRYGVVLVQQYTTANGSLAVRIAPGARDGLKVAWAKLGRLAGSTLQGKG